MKIRNSDIEKLYLFVYSFIYAICVRIITWILPMKFWINLLGNANIHTELNDINYTIKQKVFITIQRLSTHFSWTKNCLVRSIVIRKLFLKYKIETSVKLGAKLSCNSELNAHAWVFANNSNFVIYNKR